MSWLFGRKKVERETITEKDGKPLPMYTAEDVKKHSAPGDCWMIISNNVYDMSDFVPSHPGGDIILDGAGVDATEMFEDVRHSDAAEEDLKDLVIGVLKK